MERRFWLAIKWFFVLTCLVLFIAGNLIGQQITKSNDPIIKAVVVYITPLILLIGLIIFVYLVTKTVRKSGIKHVSITLVEDSKSTVQEVTDKMTLKICCLSLGFCLGVATLSLILISILV